MLTQSISWVQERSDNFFAPLNHSQVSGRLFIFSEKIWGDLLWNADVQAQWASARTGHIHPTSWMQRDIPFFVLRFNKWTIAGWLHLYKYPLRKKNTLLPVKPSYERPCGVTYKTAWPLADFFYFCLFVWFIQNKLAVCIMFFLKLQVKDLFCSRKGKWQD